MPAPVHGLGRSASLGQVSRSRSPWRTSAVTTWGNAPPESEHSPARCRSARSRSPMVVVKGHRRRRLSSRPREARVEEGRWSVRGGGSGVGCCGGHGRRAGQVRPALRPRRSAPVAASQGRTSRPRLLSRETRRSVRAGARRWRSARVSAPRTAPEPGCSCAGGSTMAGGSVGDLGLVLRLPWDGDLPAGSDQVGIGQSSRRRAARCPRGVEELGVARRVAEFRLGDLGQGVSGLDDVRVVADRSAARAR